MIVRDLNNRAFAPYLCNRKRFVLGLAIVNRNGDEGEPLIEHGHMEGEAMRWYLAVLKKYAVFSGRARRKEYWLFALVNGIITVVLVAIDASAGLVNAENGLGTLSGFYTLGTFIPSVAVTVRRLHDTDHSGWWSLIALVPFFGPIALLVFMVRDGQPCYNHFGPDPKGTATPSRPSILTPTPGPVGT